MKTIRDFVSVMDLQTLVVTLLAVGATYLCQRFGWLADIPTGLIGLAVVFPIVFSINAAYRRREEALKSFASLKAHAVAIFYAHRDWVPDGKGGDHAPRARQVILDLLTGIREYFGWGWPDDKDPNLAKVYGRFSAFSKSIEEMRAAGLTAGEASRSNQYMRAMMIDFERMRNILAYRTPVALRAYSKVFLNIFPILFGPYFAYIAESKSDYPIIGYAVAVLYALVLVSLDNIQEKLEMPFDSVGRDDLRLDVGPLYSPVLD